MIRWKVFAVAMLSLALFAALPLMAQQTAPSQPATQAAGASAAQGAGSQGQGTVAKNGQPRSSQPNGSQQIKGSKHEACWKQAGIPQSVIEQRKSIEENAHSQVQGVCSDSSLSQQQKMQKIREIRKDAHQQLEGLLSPQQQEALKQCQREHVGAGAHSGAAHGGAAHAGNPCAGAGAGDE